MTTLTATEARNGFADLIREAEVKVIQITQHNKPTAAVMSWDYYESLLETLEILSDPETISSIKQSEKEYDADLFTNWEDVKRRLIRNQ